MKKILSYILVFISLMAISQTRVDEKIGEIYVKSKKRYDSLELKDERIDRLETKRQDFKNAYSKLLNLQDYNNVNIQNALVSNYTTKYNAEKITIAFTNKQEVEAKISQYEEAFITVLSKYYLEATIKYLDNWTAAYESYVENNLKRLRITRKEYEALSEEDKKLLWNEFKR